MASPTPVDELAPVVAAACAGNREAFDELVRLTYRDTLQLARRLAGNEQDARDIVQDAYLRAYRGLRRFRGDSRFRTWLFRITVNCASSHASRDRRHRHDQLTADHQAGLEQGGTHGYIFSTFVQALRNGAHAVPKFKAQVPKLADQTLQFGRQCRGGLGGEKHQDVDIRIWKQIAATVSADRKQRSRSGQAM